MGGIMTQHVARFGSPEVTINKGFGVIHFGHQERRKKEGSLREETMPKEGKNLPKNKEEKALLGNSSYQCKAFQTTSKL